MFSMALSCRKNLDAILKAISEIEDEVGMI